MKPSCFQKLTSALKSAASVSLPRSRLSPPPTQGTLANTFERSPFLTETEHLDSQIAEFDISDLLAGTYYLKLEDLNNNLNTKFIIFARICEWEWKYLVYWK